MDRKRASRQMGELFGGMMFIPTTLLVIILVKNHGKIHNLIENSPVTFYSVISIITMGWIVTAGLFLDRAWARSVAVFSAAVFLFVDYFMAASQLSTSPGPAGNVQIAFTVRSSLLFEVLAAAWGLTLFYLFFASRPAEPVASSLSVEVLNTK